MIKQDNMRSWFAYELYQQMEKDNDIWLLTADLGFGLWDQIRRDFPLRFINVGAAEQSLLDIGVGLSLEGKKPFCYSITTFLLYRGFETIRTYINHELIPVRLIGGGRDKDYSHDGFSHWSEDASILLDNMCHQIETYWPETKEEIPELVNEMVNDNSPQFVSLRR